jgi:hypothetical protein
LAGPKIQRIDVDMFVRLSRSKRLRAGWLIALIYLLCVLAPTISFALPGSQAVAPCLIDASRPPGVVHLHNDAPAQHVHPHDHSGGHSHANPDGDYRSVSVALNSKPIPDKAPHSHDQQCCGLTCVTALPTSLIDITKPSAPTALCEVEGYRKVSDNAPPRHYRPPIS